MSTNNTQTRGFKKYFPFLTWLPIAQKTWKDDLIAGITGTIIVIPQAVAFAMIAGLPPIYGFYTAMVAPLVAALFGSSYHLISGPTTTGSIVIFSIITKFYHPETEIEAYVAMTILLSFMAGTIKLLMGLFKMGKLVNFVSNSVVIGFTAGAGILIAFKQLKHVFGISVPQGSGIYKIITYLSGHIAETNLYTFTVAIITFLSAFLIKKYIKKLSKFSMLIAMVIGTLLAILLGGNAVGIETVGQIPNHLPPFKIPNFEISWVKELFSGAIILALLGLVEAVSISRSIALYSHQKLNSNQEFIGQGLSNIISSFFSSYVSSGSFTRSGVNYQAGAKTPLAAIIASLGLMLVLLFGAKYASYLPKPAMGGIILLVGYSLIDIEHIKKVIKSSNRELIVLLITMLGTIFFKELSYALLTGIMFSFLFYMERTSNPHIATVGRNSAGNFINILRDGNAYEDENIKIIRVDGSLYFGAIKPVSDFFSELYKTDYKYVLIIANGINFIDLASADWLEHEAKKWEEKGGGLYFSNMNNVAQDVLIKGGFKAKIGEDHFFYTKREAMKFLEGEIMKNENSKLENKEEEMDEL